MRNRKNLAIVIPAYKNIFFKETLQSISDQTNKNFTLYIGDDFSPDNFSEIILPFLNKMDIVYKRFEKNLGRTDLVAHWQRCVELINGEEWVWLFSDDDLMDPECVEEFYRETDKEALCSLYHFNVERINYGGQTILFEKKYPRDLPGVEFLNKLINFKITSYVIEYIFNYQKFKILGGFEKFDLAWGSDHATWLKLSFEGVIKTFPNSKVKWRSSGFNITSLNDKNLSCTKRNSELIYYQWLVDFFSNKSVPLPFSKFSSIRWFLQGILIHIFQHGFREVPKWIYRFSRVRGGNKLLVECYFYLSLYSVNILCRNSGRRFKKLVLKK